MAQFSLRLPRELHARLVAAAEKDRRSLNEFLVVLLAEALDARKPTPHRPARPARGEE